MYGTDLAYIHQHGFSQFARDTSPVVVALLREAGIDQGLVVDLGCGSGILAGELLGHGYDVLGVDISEAMITVAREQVPGATFVVESLHEFRIPKCAAITAIGEPFTYAPSGEEEREATLRATLARCAGALGTGGLLLFDVMRHTEGEPMRYRHWSAEGDDWMIAVDVAEEPEARLITRTMWMYRAEGERYRRTTEVHRVWTFTLEELRTWLGEAGFSIRFGGWPCLLYTSDAADD